MENYSELLEEAQLALDLKEINKAIDLFENILKLNPINSDANYGLGNCYYELKDYETAINYFEQVIQTSNYYCGDSYAMLGICNMNLAEECTTNEIKYELKAIEYYKKIINHYPKKIDEGILTDLALAYGYIKDLITLF